MGVHERKARERAERRAVFLRSARELFVANGYKGASMQQIAKQAEFSKRSVYLYFDDKREVFLAVVLEGLERLHEALEAAVTTAREAGASALDQLLALVAAYYRFSQESPEDFRLILEFEARDYYYQRSATELGEFASQCVAVNDRNTTLLLDGIARGQEDGSVRADSKPIDLMLVAWAQAMGTVQVVQMRADQLSSPHYQTTPQQLFDLSIDHLRRGLTSHAEPHR